VAVPPSTGPASRWPDLLRIAIQTLAGLLFIGAGFRILGTGPLWLGLVMLGLGGVTAVLSLRRLVGLRDAGSRGLTEKGDLSGHEYDSIIWTAVGLPFFSASRS
jgi:hypothetical protein